MKCENTAHYKKKLECHMKLISMMLVTSAAYLASCIIVNGLDRSISVCRGIFLLSNSIAFQCR